MTPAADEEGLRFHREFMESRTGNGVPRPEGVLDTGTYRLNPYHDLNGAGLLYFASYPHINDYCERGYFHELARAGSAVAGVEWAVDASTVFRDVLYLGNCGPDETVVCRLHSWRLTDDRRVRLESTLSRESDVLLHRFGSIGRRELLRELSRVALITPAWIPRRGRGHRLSVGVCHVADNRDGIREVTRRIVSIFLPRAGGNSADAAELPEVRAGTDSARIPHSEQLNRSPDALSTSVCPSCRGRCLMRLQQSDRSRMASLHPSRTWWPRSARARPNPTSGG
jgi:hypothetical protein